MIIQMNATVCAAEGHGEGGRHKVAGNYRRGRRRVRVKGANDQGKQGFRFIAETVGSNLPCGTTRPQKGSVPSGR